MSSSALFERELVNETSYVSLNRTLEPRLLPVGIEDLVGANRLPDNINVSTVELERQTMVDVDLYWIEPRGWIHSAVNQLTRNGSEPPWSRDGWSFTPVNLADAAHTGNGTVSAFPLELIISLKLCREFRLKHHLSGVVSSASPPLRAITLETCPLGWAHMTLLMIPYGIRRRIHRASLKATGSRRMPHTRLRTQSLPSVRITQAEHLGEEDGPIFQVESKAASPTHSPLGHSHSL